MTAEAVIVFVVILGFIIYEIIGIANHVSKHYQDDDKNDKR